MQTRVLLWGVEGGLRGACRAQAGWKVPEREQNPSCSSWAAVPDRDLMVGDGWVEETERGPRVLVFGYLVPLTLWPKVPQLREGTSSCHHIHGSTPAWPGGPMAREVKALSVKALSVLGLFGGTTRDSEIPGLNLGHAVSSNQAGVEFNV